MAQRMSVNQVMSNLFQRTPLLWAPPCRSVMLGGRKEIRMNERAILHKDLVIRKSNHNHIRPNDATTVCVGDFITDCQIARNWRSFEEVLFGHLFHINHNDDLTIKVKIYQSIKAKLIW